MADGTAADKIEAAVEIDKVTLGHRLSWFIRKREGLLTLWVITAASALVAVLVWHSFVQSVLDSGEAKTSFLAATALLILPLLLLLLDPDDNFSEGPRVRLPFFCVLILVSLAGISLADRFMETNWFGSHGLQTQSNQVYLNLGTFFVFFIVAFIPLVWNSRNFSKYEISRLTSKSFSENEDIASKDADKDAEAMGALVATLIVLGIGTLAWVAGETGSQLKFANVFGLVLCGVVIGVFAIVVFLDYISESAPVRALSSGLRWLSRRMRWLSEFYKYVDTRLVRLGASVAGMNHRSARSRYVVLASMLVSLLIIAWNMSAPLGLIPCAVAFTLAISVSRLWSWVEEDRSLAAMTEYNTQAPYKIGFREDFRDETLLGFIFVFMVVPIAMMQAHESAIFGKELFENANEKNFFSWFGFFGVELAKAVPIVDWAEIYQIGPGDKLIKINEDNTASKHSVFLARVMVDLVLIAALVQAIGIANRNRQQKRLYIAQHIDRLDHFVERRELDRSIKTSLLVQPTSVPEVPTKEQALQLFDLTRIQNSSVLDFTNYNEDRIFHLHVTEKSNVIRAFTAAVAYHNNIPLKRAIDIVKDVANSDKDEYELIRSFDRALMEHESKIRILDVGDLYEILSALRQNSGFRDFKERVMDQMKSLGPSSETMDSLQGIAFGPKADHFQYARNYAARTIVALAQATDDRNAVLVSLDAFEKVPDERDKIPQKQVLARTIKSLRARLDVLSA